MKISGLQKLTLLDFPGRVACTVFLGGCNFRCPFCHNSQLLGGDAEELMDSSALLDFLGKRRGVPFCVSSFLRTFRNGEIFAGVGYEVRGNEALYRLSE